MVVRGLAPLSELAGYQMRLNALTSGQGRYTVSLSHYELVPPNLQAQLVPKEWSQEVKAGAAKEVRFGGSGQLPTNLQVRDVRLGLGGSGLASFD